MTEIKTMGFADLSVNEMEQLDGGVIPVAGIVAIGLFTAGFAIGVG